MACEVCHEIYTPNESNETDSDVKPHLCVTCGQSFSLKIQLKRHVMLHADGAPYTCINCAKVIDKKGKTYNLRLGNSNEYTCDICQKSFNNKRLLLRHSIQHTFDRISDNEEFYENEEVEKDDAISPKQKTSSKKNSDKNELLSCNICNRNFQSWLALEKHTLTHSTTKSKSLFCQSCNRAFAYQACLDKHMKKGNCNNATPTVPVLKIKQIKNNSPEIDNKKHTCSVCSKTFTRKSTLEGHELSHILNKDTSEEEKELSDYDSDDFVSLPKKPRTSTFKLQKSYTCEKCNFVCFSKQTLNKHMNNHKESNAVNAESKSFMDESKDHSEKYDTNYETDSKKDSFECKLCNKAFKSEQRLQKHNLAHVSESNEDTETHDVNGTFMCEICDKRFLTKKILKKHLLFHVERNSNDSLSEKSITFGKQRIQRSKNLSCNICGRRFAGELCLNKHVLKHGQQEKEGATRESRPTVVKVKVKKPKVIKELICEYCKEDFTGKRAAYMKHIHAHTPEVCGICDERFVDRQSLREHCKIHVGTEEGRMFMQCSQKALEAKNGGTAPEPRVEYIYLVLR